MLLRILVNQDWTTSGMRKDERKSHCTRPEQHLWRYVVWRADQRVGQAALVLPGLPPLQRLQAVRAAAVGGVFPFLTEVHAVLPHVVP